MYSAVLPTMTNTEMTAGLAPARGLRNPEAIEVADAIVALIANPDAGSPSPAPPGRC
jgi:hypothetical protein